MSKIYTRGGDRGTTAIHGGQRVSKTDIRIEANGTLDEVNVAVGTVRSFLPVDHEWQPVLREIQLNMMNLMSLVATPDVNRDSNPNKLPEDCVHAIEEVIDCLLERCDETGHFVLPGGSVVASFLHQCRVTTRRAERRLWELDVADRVPELILRYINRLSDLFFVMAKIESQESKIGEERWTLFRRKK